MKTSIALLRGINVGGKNSISMLELRTAFTMQACSNVRSYIQSGNIVFDCDEQIIEETVQAIQEDISKRFGFRPQIQALDKEHFLGVIHNNPYPLAEGKSLHVYFLTTMPQQGFATVLDSVKVASEAYSLWGQTLYLHAPDGIGKSKLARKLETAVGCAVTARNWNTISALTKMIS